MSSAYFSCPRCLYNTEIPEEILAKVRNKEGSFLDLMSCDNCGSTPEKRKARAEIRRQKRRERLKDYKPPETVSERYERWWKGKLCRLRGSGTPFKRVVSLDISGPPSLFTAVVELVYEDGTSENVNCGINAYKPRKKDVDVKEEDQ